MCTVFAIPSIIVVDSDKPPEDQIRTQITLYKPPDPEKERRSRKSNQLTKLDSLEEITSFFQVTNGFQPHDKFQKRTGHSGKQPTTNSSEKAEKDRNYEKKVLRNEESQSEALKRKTKKTTESSYSRSPAGHKSSETQPRKNPGSDSPSRRRGNSPSRKSAESPSRRGSPSRAGARSAESPSRRGSIGNFPESPSRRGQSSSGQSGGKRSESPSRGGNNNTPPAESPIRQPGSPGIKRRHSGKTKKLNNVIKAVDGVVRSKSHELITSLSITSDDETSCGRNWKSQDCLARIPSQNDLGGSSSYPDVGTEKGSQDRGLDGKGSRDRGLDSKGSYDRGLDSKGSQDRGLDGKPGRRNRFTRMDSFNKKAGLKCSPRMNSVVVEQERVVKLGTMLSKGDSAKEIWGIPIACSEEDEPDFNTVSEKDPGSPGVSISNSSTPVKLQGGKMRTPKPVPKKHKLPDAITNADPTGKVLKKEDMIFCKKHTRFEDQTIEWWFKAFRKECPNGRLSKTHLFQLFRKKFPGGNAGTFCTHIFRIFDSDGNNYLDFKEFLMAIDISQCTDQREKLEWAFRMYDVDGSGSISLEEMKGIIMTMDELEGDDKKTGADSADARAEDLLRSLDQDGDGDLTMQEFVNGYMQLMG